jgi:hypothetical protein
MFDGQNRTNIAVTAYFQLSPHPLVCSMGLRQQSRHKHSVGSLISPLGNQHRQPRFAVYRQISTGGPSLIPFSVQPTYESYLGLAFGLALHRDLFRTIRLPLTNQHDSQVHIRHPIAPCLPTAQLMLESFGRPGLLAILASLGVSNLSSPFLTASRASSHGPQPPHGCLFFSSPASSLRSSFH